MSGKTTRILVHLRTNHSASRRFISGVLQYEATHADVETMVTDDFAFGIRDREIDLSDYAWWKPDALVIDARATELTRARLASIAVKRIVFVSTDPVFDPGMPFAVIHTDDRSIARTAADLLCRHHLENFAFVGLNGESRWSENRRETFASILEARGFSAETHVPDPSMPFENLVGDLEAFLKGLPKPCGIFAANDPCARHVLETCRRLKIRVPEQIQVIGVDDDDTICEFTSPPLSSIAPDFKAGGYAAAEFAAGKRRVSKPVHLTMPLRGAVERLSTADDGNAARHVALAREFIRKNALAGIRVDDVAAAAKISRRLLQREFPEITGRTVIEELIEVRLTAVKRRLRETKNSVEQISSMCGFKSSSHLKTLFKRRFGVTMREYRDGSRAASKSALVKKALFS